MGILHRRGRAVAASGPADHPEVHQACSMGWGSHLQHSWAHFLRCGYVCVCVCVVSMCVVCVCVCILCVWVVVVISVYYTPLFVCRVSICMYAHMYCYLPTSVCVFLYCVCVYMCGLTLLTHKQTQLPLHTPVQRLPRPQRHMRTCTTCGLRCV